MPRSEGCPVWLCFAMRTFVCNSLRGLSIPPASLLPDLAAMTSQLQRHAPVPRKDRAIPLECTECRARYIAVLADDPPDWKPHCIECDTPFGPVRGRAVYSLFAVFD